MSCRTAAVCRRVVKTVLVVIASVGGACSKRSELVPVTGEVTLDGKPLAGATVTFLPRQGGQPGTGVTDDQGQFRLTTSPVGAGAIPGPHAVVIALVRYKDRPGSQAAATGGDPAAVSGAPPPDIETIVPARYNDPSLSGLEASVTQSMNRFSFALSSQPR